MIYPTNDELNLLPDHFWTRIISKKSLQPTVLGYLKLTENFCTQRLGNEFTQKLYYFIQVIVIGRLSGDEVKMYTYYTLYHLSFDIIRYKTQHW